MFVALSGKLLRPLGNHVSRRRGGGGKRSNSPCFASGGGLGGAQRCLQESRGEKTFVATLLSGGGHEEGQFIILAGKLGVRAGLVS